MGWLASLRELNWTLLLTAIAFQAVSFGTSVYSFTFFVLPWEEEFSIGRSTVMQASLALSLAAGLAGPVVARLLITHGVRRIVVSGLLLCAAGSLVASSASGFLVIGLCYALLIGPGIALAGPVSAQVLVNTGIPQPLRGLGFGIVLTGTSVGGILFAPLAGYGVASFGWRTSIATIAPVAALMTLPLVLRYVPTIVAAQASAGRDTNSDPARILGSPVFWVALIPAVPALLSFTAVQYHLDPLARSLGIDVGLTSAAMSLMAGSMIVTKVVVGHLCDRFDPKVLGLSLVMVAAIALTWLSYGPRGAHFLAACLLMGCASGSVLPLLAAYFAKAYSPTAFAAAMGCATPLLALSGFGGVAAGWLHGSLSSYSAGFVILAAIVVGSGASAALLSRRRSAVTP